MAKMTEQVMKGKVQKASPELVAEAQQLAIAVNNNLTQVCIPPFSSPLSRKKKKNPLLRNKKAKQCYQNHPLATGSLEAGGLEWGSKVCDRGA